VKKRGILLAISLASVLLFSGTLVVSACPREGNTPGFWKRHLDAWKPTGLSPNMLVGDYFVIPASLSDLADDSLLQALKYKGGKGPEAKARILLRAAVAGLLNFYHPEVNYIYRYVDLQWLVNYPISRFNEDMMISNKDLIDDQNNLGSNLG
jgi:hypothetical protein